MSLLGSDRGARAVRQYVIECAAVRPGMNVLIVCARDGGEHFAKLAEMIAVECRELGATVIELHADSVFGDPKEAVGVSFRGVDRQRFARPLFQAIAAADLVFALMPGGLAHGRYNIDGYTLSNYYDTPVHEALDIYAAAAHPEIFDFPADLLAAIADAAVAWLLSAAEAGATFHLTDPAGTEIRFQALPGDIGLHAGGIRQWPQKRRFGYVWNHRLTRALVGFGPLQQADGVYVAPPPHTPGGTSGEPVHVTLENGFVRHIAGCDHLQDLATVCSAEPLGVHALLFGVHPKYDPYENGRYLFPNAGAGAGQCHLALGAPGLFYRSGRWGALGRNHIPMGDVGAVSLRAGDSWLFRSGHLEVLEDERVRAAARRLGDPEELLEQFHWTETTKNSLPPSQSFAIAPVAPVEHGESGSPPPSAALQARFARFVALAEQHSAGLEIARAFDRVVDFDLTDAGPFQLIAHKGTLRVADGASGLDWRFRDWERCSIVRTSAKCLEEIISGHLSPVEAYFDERLGFAPRMSASREATGQEWIVWFLNIFRLAEEQAQATGRAQLAAGL